MALREECDSIQVLSACHHWGGVHQVCSGVQCACACACSCAGVPHAACVQEVQGGAGERCRRCRSRRCRMSRCRRKLKKVHKEGAGEGEGGAGA